MSDSFACNYTLYPKPAPAPPLKKGMTPLWSDRLKPPTYYYHYSNPASQGAVAAQTAGFPAGYYPNRESEASAYSDRIHSWDPERYKRACAIIGGGCQVWRTRASGVFDDVLRQFAQEALGLPVLPTHVRLIHYYNVSNGYSCPVVQAIYPKPDKQ